MSEIKVLEDFKDVEKVYSVEFYKECPNTKFVSGYNYEKLNKILKEKHFVLSDKSFDFLKKGLDVLHISDDEGCMKINYLLTFNEDVYTLKTIMKFVVERNEEVWIDTYEMKNLIYNDNTKELELINDLFIIDMFRNDEHKKQIYFLIEFLESIIRNTEPYVSEAYFEGDSLRKQITYTPNPNITLRNMWNLVIHNPKEFEKLLKTEMDFLANNINTMVLEIKAANSVSNILGLNKVLLQGLKEIDKMDQIERFQKLNKFRQYDGNDYKILVRFLKAFINQKDVYLNDVIIRLVTEILLLEHLNMKKFIDNVIKNMIYSNYGNSYSYENNLNRSIRKSVIDILTLYKDYLKMCKQNNVEAIKYPSNIIREHNTVMKNLNINVKEKDLKVAVEAYEGMIDSFKSNNYTLALPYTKEDLITEGLTLHHCVTSYAEDIVKGNSKIFFLRDKTKKEEPFVTIEVSKDNKLNHIKGKYNIDLEDDIIIMVNDWLKEY